MKDEVLSMKYEGGIRNQELGIKPTDTTDL